MSQFLLRARDGRLARRLLRYASVSLISTTTSLTILGVLVGVVGMAAMWANLVAIAVGTVPSFELNRRWVWSLGDERPRLAQILPFCLLSFSGLALSSLAVRVAASLTTSDGRLVRTAAVEAANLGSYGALWVIQFVLCDRLLFRDRPASSTQIEPAVGLPATEPIEFVLVTAGASGGPAAITDPVSQDSRSSFARGGQTPPFN